MMSIIINDIYIDHLGHETCSPTQEFPNGKYPNVEITLSTGEVLMGKTCQCLKGHKTYGTWKLPSIGDKFNDREEIFKYLNNEMPTRPNF